jgi:hypothetical protein
MGALDVKEKADRRGVRKLKGSAGALSEGFKGHAFQNPA